MSLFPKVGTLESIVLKKLIENPDGINFLDFPEDSELHNPDKLEQIINNLRTGMFESEDDETLTFDS